MTIEDHNEFRERLATLEAQVVEISQQIHDMRASVDKNGEEVTKFNVYHKVGVSIVVGIASFFGWAVSTFFKGG